MTNLEFYRRGDLQIRPSHQHFVWRESTSARPAGPEKCPGAAFSGCCRQWRRTFRPETDSAEADCDLVLGKAVHGYGVPAAPAAVPLEHVSLC